MPELPEVHALAADLDARLRGRVVERLDVPGFHALKTFDPPVSALAGRRVEAVGRHGKFLDIDTDGLHLIVHLSLAGWVRWHEECPAAPPGRRSPVAARLVLAGGPCLDVTEAGTRKSLSIHLVADPADVPGVAALGPDALEVDEAGFTRILEAAGRMQLKTLLRRQSLIAGIGNAYSDEILHAARMSPFRSADLGPDDAARLYAAMRGTLSDALARAEGHAAGDLKREKRAGLAVHGRFGEACGVCGDVIQQVVFSDSSFQYCPTCQTGGKKLSDRGMDRLLT